MDVTMEKVMLPEYEGFALLDKYGIPVPEHYTARTEKDAADCAERIGFPVVMKVISPQVVHKSDAGGVITGIETREQVYSSFRRIEHNVGLSSPDAVIEGVIVEKQYRKGLELILGGRTDPSFGKVITFGIGGTLVELIRDVAIRILPVTQEEIRAMVHEIRAYPLIRGYRNSPPLDEEELVRIIVAVCRFFERNRPFASLIQPAHSFTTREGSLLMPGSTPETRFLFIQKTPGPRWTHHCFLRRPLQ